MRTNKFQLFLNYRFKGLRPTLLLLFLLHELSVFIVMLHRNVFMFYVLFYIVLLLSYSVS